MSEIDGGVAGRRSLPWVITSDERFVGLAATREDAIVLARLTVPRRWH